MVVQPVALTVLSMLQGGRLEEAAAPGSRCKVPEGEAHVRPLLSRCGAARMRRTKQARTTVSRHMYCTYRNTCENCVLVHMPAVGQHPTL